MNRSRKKPALAFQLFLETHTGNGPSLDKHDKERRRILTVIPRIRNRENARPGWGKSSHKITEFIPRSQAAASALGVRAHRAGHGMIPRSQKGGYARGPPSHTRRRKRHKSSRHRSPAREEERFAVHGKDVFECNPAPLRTRQAEGRGLQSTRSPRRRVRRSGPEAPLLQCREDREVRGAGGGRGGAPKNSMARLENRESVQAVW